MIYGIKHAWTLFLIFPLTWILVPTLLHFAVIGGIHALLQRDPLALRAMLAAITFGDLILLGIIFLNLWSQNRQENVKVWRILAK